MRRTILSAAAVLAVSCSFVGRVSAQEDFFLLSDEKLLSELQGQKWGDNWTSSVGGALRYRYIDEQNRLRPPLAAGQSDYQQWRFNPYVEVKYGNDITFYVEGIDASTFGETLPEVAIDTNRFDLLQYYADFNLIDFDDDSSLHFKVGRQFLIYGTQHLISNLGWGNTFRNFEGGKLYYTSSDWNIDAFLVRPVHEPSAAVHPTSFDSPDQSRMFTGVYSTYKGFENKTIDIYWLWFREQEDRMDRIEGNRHTIGARYAGSMPLESASGDKYSFLWDLESGLQFGKEDFNGVMNEDIRAAFVSANGGLKFSDMPWTPTLNGIFWYGSGDSTPGNGTNNTVSSLFPLGHAYWGQIDNFNGSNLLDYGVHLTVNPTEKFSFLAGWHLFNKAAENDAIYNIAGAPFGGVSTTSGSLGQELDLVATYKLNKNFTLQAGYFHFWYGDAVTMNPNAVVAARGDADQVYLSADWAF
ncbi:MAG: alginate export family protein [Planctomycetaceae bacterium]